MTANRNFQRFNLETMSGIFPGTHTQVFQRLQLQRIVAPAGELVWAQTLWYAEPAACVVYLQDADWQSKGHKVREVIPLLRLADPLVADFNQRFQAALQQTGWQMQSCGSCRFWQAVNAKTPDQLPAGRCAWQRALNGPGTTPVNLATQSNLALSCLHWQLAQETLEHNDAPTTVPALIPMRKAAETSESKLPYWTRRWKQLIRLGKAPRLRQSWAERLVERSGVGAGTEACFACQGRIANLGALAVETPEGDKQTFSIWRCRTCYTMYLNNWIDRWERLDSLETEETYYRVAPAEAFDLLQMMDQVAGGDHPGRRRERHVEREQILHFLSGRTPLSHQIRQGR